MTKDEIVERLKNFKKIDKAIIILQRKLESWTITTTILQLVLNKGIFQQGKHYWKKLINTFKRKKDDITRKIKDLD